MNKTKLFRLLFIFLFFLFAFLFNLKKINLATADIGRHIKNGEIILSSKKFIYSNTYSYTYPNFPTITHHWGSGVVYYLVWKLFGFAGISVFQALVYTSTVFFIFLLAKKLSNLETAVALALFALPLISSRTEIRPESFSYLFIALYLYVLHLLKQGDLRFGYGVLMLTALQILWVNLHILFVLGIFITGVFAVSSRANFRKFMPIVPFLIMVSLANPYFIKGLLAPLTIFRNYGYMIVENQSVFFMQKRLPNFLYIHAELTALLFMFSLLWLVFQSKDKLVKNLEFLLIALTFSAMAFLAIRSIPLMGLALVPFFATALSNVTSHTYLRLMSVFLLIAGLFLQNHYFSFRKYDFGWGLHLGAEKSARFFKDAGLKGPTFNNYDIGGYLIFNFFPQERVFVDNRPEAYPENFFGRIYIPMQELESIWKKQDEKYGFSVIYFYRRDFTPWAQPFLIKRLDDPKWVPVFVDDYAIILAKNSVDNLAIISKYKLPKETFLITN